MISSEEALASILTNNLNLLSESVEFETAFGRTLAEDIFADRDFPPFDRVSMDGIAIRFQDYENGTREFLVKDLQAAGDPKLFMPDGPICFEVMTGAICPENSDTVIQYEHLDKTEDVFELKEEVRANQNVHKQGLDRKSGDLLMPKGKVIGHAEIGVLASVGKNEIQVLRKPTIAIYSTGNELVDVSETPKEHQIRKSNVHVLRTLLTEMGLEATSKHLSDNKQEIHKELENALTQYDIIFMSGGVSKGKLDFIPEVLDELKVEKTFHRVTQRPGKPLWFGKKDNCLVFGFPGNPVSTLVCFIKYARPLLNKILLKNEGAFYHAILQEDVSFKPNLTYFLQVNIKNEEGKILAEPNHGKGSGDLANLLDSDGVLELPKGKNEYQKGEVFNYLRIR